MPRSNDRTQLPVPDPALLLHHRNPPSIKQAGYASSVALQTGTGVTCNNGQRKSAARKTCAASISRAALGGAAHQKLLRRKFLARQPWFIRWGFSEISKLAGAGSCLAEIDRPDCRRAPGAFAGFAAAVASGIVLILGGGGDFDMAE